MPIALIPALNPLLAFIAAGEGGYNSMNQGTSGGRIVGSTHNAASILGKNLTDMTIGEVIAHQSSSPRRLFAAGRYQVIPQTMQGILPATGLSTSDLFNQANQDRFGIALIKQRRDAWNYLTGKSNDRNAALLALAKEWASLPDPRTGNSYYGSGNRAQHSVDEVARALDSARAAMAGGGGGGGGGGDTTLGAASATAGPNPLVIAVVIGIAYLFLRNRR
jgi:hypothetical protein